MKKCYYNCPIYKYPKRNDKYLITRCYLKPEANPNPNQKETAKSGVVTSVMKWKLCGVSLLCSKD